ncbi:MAG: hypothetical protein ABI171_15010 [Collimonas sp.]|uniref:hypothetical protein n=1 Tax=Collimonas sp. TaxID=1963772 RepID=UPI003267557F
MKNWLRHPASDAKPQQAVDMQNAGRQPLKGMPEMQQAALVADTAGRDAIVPALPQAGQPARLTTATQVQLASAAKPDVTTVDGHVLAQGLLQKLRLSLNLPALAEMAPEPHQQTFVSDLQTMAAAKGLGAFASDTARQQLRIHAQWQGQDVQLWLGIDGQHGMLPEELAQIVRESQSWLAAQGARLLSVTCNGQPIYTVSGDNRTVSDKTQPAQLEDAQPKRPSFAGHFPYSYFDSQEA